MDLIHYSEIILLIISLAIIFGAMLFIWEIKRMIIDEIEIDTNRNLLGIEDELIESVTNYRENGVLIRIFVKEVKSILSKDTGNLLYRFHAIYNNTDIINKYFNKIQIRANKGEDILRLQEYYYLINILVNEIKTIKMNYVIRRINYLFSSYNIPKAKGNMIKKEIKRYIELIKSRILNSNFYKELNLIALEIVLEVAEKFNLSLSKAI